MKILKTLPKMSDLLKHDAPVLRVIRVSLIAFVLISSITVFLGVRVHIQEYLSNLSPITRYPAYGVAYLAFSLVPDTLSVILFAFVVRSFLKGHYADTLSIILVSACTLVTVFLVRYSWNMSRNAAHSYAIHITPEAAETNTAAIEDRSTDRTREIEATYRKEVALVENRYDELLRASTAPLRAKSTPLEQKIMRLEEKRTEQNTYWTDREIGKLEQQLTPIEEEAAAIRKNLTEKKNAELAQLKANKDQRIATIESRSEEDRTIALAENEAEKERTNTISAILVRELRNVAGFAIFIVLLLTGLMEILYHRNGVDREPIIGEFDLRSSMVSEVVSLPFVYIGRHLINWVRERYEQLPDLRPGPWKNNADLKTNLNSLKTPLNEVFNGVKNTDNQHLIGLNEGGGYDDLFNDYLKPVLNESDTPHDDRQENGIPPHDDRRKNGSSDHDDRAPLKEVIWKEHLRECAHDECNNQFFPNAPKHIYCNDDCRRAAWEKNTGKTLKYKPKTT